MYIASSQLYLLYQCLATDQAVDLLRRILCLSSHERLTADAALEHPFFED